MAQILSDYVLNTFQSIGCRHFVGALELDPSGSAEYLSVDRL